MIISETFPELSTRIERSFSDIDNDIMMDLQRTDSEYRQLLQKISELKKSYPAINAVLEGSGELRLNSEEHTALLHFLTMYHKMDEMERLHLYFRGHTDAYAYLKRIGAL